MEYARRMLMEQEAASFGLCALNKYASTNRFSITSVEKQPSTRTWGLARWRIVSGIALAMDMALLDMALNGHGFAIGWFLDMAVNMAVSVLMAMIKDMDAVAVAMWESKLILVDASMASFRPKSCGSLTLPSSAPLLCSKLLAAQGHMVICCNPFEWKSLTKGLDHVGMSRASAGDNTTIAMVGGQ